MEVRVVEANLRWPDLFQEEAEKISDILGDELVAIHHIGSTAIENLAAKPIIDIMPVVKDIGRVDALNAEFVALGYEALGEYGISGRRYFRKGFPVRTHQVHIFEEKNHRDIQRHLALRDYLRSHPIEAAEYGRLKMELARLYPRDIVGYMDGKDAFVKNLETKALQWSRRRKPKNGINIRHAKSDDGESLAGLIAGFRMELDGLKFPESTFDLCKARQELNGYLKEEMPIFVAEDETKNLLGYLVCRIDGDVVWAESLFTVPEARRSGIATSLYREAEKLAQSHGQDTVYNWVHPNNTKIITFLAKLGYDVLNLIEIRRPRKNELLSGTIEVDGHNYKY